MSWRRYEVVQVLANTLRMNQMSGDMNISAQQNDTRNVLVANKIEQRVTLIPVSEHVVGLTIFLILPDLAHREHFERRAGGLESV